MKYLLLIIAIVTFLSCEKESTTIVDNNDPNASLSEVPMIELEGISATTITAYADTLAFFIKYEDGDGDLGDVDPDGQTIELVDQRSPDNLIFYYHVSPRAPLDADIAITGNLTIVLGSIILLDDDNDEETTTFTIKIKDRAGNESNIVETDPIIIIR